MEENRETTERTMQCRVCGNQGPLSNFPKSKRKSNGSIYWIQICHKCNYARKRGLRKPVRLSGPLHPNWKGDQATTGTGRNRASRIYQLGDCERCGKPAFDRHHKDEDTKNNEPSNVSILCRRCHMEVDGRLSEFVRTAYRVKPHPPKPCVNCGRLYKPLRKGRCGPCYSYLGRHGCERTLEAVKWWYKIHPKSRYEEQ